MREVFQEVVKELEDGHPLVLATVVRTKGSTPQKPGATLLVRHDGSGVGTLGGGCVEGDIWFAAKELMKRGGPSHHRDYELNEDLAAEDGLVCGGTMFFLIDPVYQPDYYLDIAKEIDSAYRGGPAVAVANLVKSGHGQMEAIGSKLLIRDDGTKCGSLGSEALDRDASCNAADLMVLGKNKYVVSETGAEYFIEGHTTPPQMLLCGGGHVSKALAPMAKAVGFHVFVTDDREEFASSERFPEADRLVVAKPETAFPQLPISPNTFVIIATRGHRYDNVALEAAALTSAKYVGLLGSRRKTVLIYEDLIRSGVPVERVREIRSPIGLDIHARTPEEIAVSIIAEVLMFRLGGTGLPMKLDEALLEKIISKVGKIDPVVVGN